MGRARPDAKVTVLKLDGQKAELFADNFGTPLANPITTNKQGEFEFYAANGRYSLQIVAPGYPGETDQDVILTLDPVDFVSDVIDPMLEVQKQEIEAEISGIVQEAGAARDEAVSSASAAGQSAANAAASEVASGENADRAEAAAELAMQGDKVVYAETLADLQAIVPPDPQTPGVVWNDPSDTDEDPVNGNYVWDGSAWERSGVQPATQAQLEEIGAEVEAIAGKFRSLALYTYAGSGPKYPLVIDRDYRKVLWVNAETNAVEGAGLVGAVELAPMVERMVGSSFADRGIWTQDADSETPGVLLDQDGRVLLGFNRVTGRIIGAGLSGGDGSGPQRSSYEPLAQEDKIPDSDVVIVVGYGQSLVVGATSLPVLTTSQPYANLTYAGGPRSGSEQLTSLIPLVENSVSPAPDGGTNRGETACSSAANYAVELAAMEHGVDPESASYVASVAGHGGYAINQLKKGSEWYPLFAAHLGAAPSLLSGDGKSSTVGVMFWMQGEADVSLQTPFATYRQELSQLRADAEADTNASLGRNDPLHCITYQTTWGITTHSDVALAQLSLCMQDSRFTLAAPMYLFPYSPDNIHLTNVGEAWFGHYVGRAIATLRRGYQHKWLRPLSATSRGSLVSIRFDVPVMPLVLDATNLPPTTDSGFRVLDDSGTVPISSVSIGDGDSVEIVLGRALVGVATIRYALDYAGTGLLVENGASGNLRDSETAMCKINGVQYPLFNAAPHFQLPIIQLAN